MEGEEGPGVTGLEAAGSHEISELPGKSQKPQCVRDRGTLSPDPAGDVLLGQSELGLELLEQLELHVVYEGAALQRVELLDRLGHLARAELVHGVEEELVGTRGVVLERRGGEAADPQPVDVDRLAGCRGELALDRATDPDVRP